MKSIFKDNTNIKSIFKDNDNMKSIFKDKANMKNIFKDNTNMKTYLRITLIWKAYLRITLMWKAYLRITLIWKAHLRITVIRKAYLRITLMWKAYLGLTLIWNAYLRQKILKKCDRDECASTEDQNNRFLWRMKLNFAFRNMKFFWTFLFLCNVRKDTTSPIWEMLTAVKNEWKWLSVLNTIIVTPPSNIRLYLSPSCVVVTKQHQKKENFMR